MSIGNGGNMTRLETLAFSPLEFTKGKNCIEGDELRELVRRLDMVYTAVVASEAGKDSEPCPLCGTSVRRDGKIIVDPKLVKLKCR